jgi:allophanate hydrolase
MTTWIHRRPAEQIAAELAAAAGPLAGLTVAVKDNIDVAGLPTTCACPAFAYTPARDATAVARLRAAGAVIAGKANMDQFATGLVGTRSPYGAVADLRRPAYAGGGSSSGSAAAVAAGEADIALGTDTAGSGRVPAAFQGIVGAKPSIGLVPVDGVVPACRSFDCVSVFARSVALAERVLDAIGEAPSGPAGAPPEPRLATFDISAASESFRSSFAKAVDELDLTAIDAEPFLEAGELLYGGGFAAERYAAVGRFIEAHREDCDPIVAAIILGGREITGAQYVADVERLDVLRLRVRSLLAGFDGLVLPTAPFQPTLAEVAADPVGVNRELGVFSTFCNLLGLCARSVPAGGADGFGVTVFAPAGHDRVAADLARLIERGLPDDSLSPPPGTVALLVVGAHMSGMPLNGELVARGGRLLGPVSTAPDYRLYALDTVPAKPGLVRGGYASIEGELWALPPGGLASLLASLPQPMVLGRVALADGREVVGFLCEPAALADAAEITGHGGWRAYLLASVGSTG